MSLTPPPKAPGPPRKPAFAKFKPQPTSTVITGDAVASQVELELQRQAELKQIKAEQQDISQRMLKQLIEEEQIAKQLFTEEELSSIEQPITIQETPMSDDTYKKPFPIGTPLMGTSNEKPITNLSSLSYENVNNAPIPPTKSEEYVLEVEVTEKDVLDMVENEDTNEPTEDPVETTEEIEVDLELKQDPMPEQEQEKTVKDIPITIKDTNELSIDMSQEEVQEILGDEFRHQELKTNASKIVVDQEEDVVEDNVSEEIFNAENISIEEDEVSIDELEIKTHEAIGPEAQADLDRQILEEAKKEMEDRDEDPSMIVIPFCSPEQIVKEHVEIAETMTPQEYDRARTEDERFQQLAEEGRFFNPQQQFNKEALTEALNRKQELTKRWVNEKTGTKHGPTTISRKHMKFQNGANIVDDDAGVYVAAMTNGVKQIYLPNSGFSMHLRAPKNTELDAFYTNTFRNYFEHGRTLGQYYFVPADTEIKGSIMELLPNWIVKCNLLNWNVGDRLQKFLSFHDYDPVLWAVATLMHPDGVHLDFVCHEEGCPNPKQTIHVDLNQLIFFNHTAMSLEAKTFLYSKETKNDEQLAEYKKMLGFNIERQLHDNWYGAMQVPSMFEHLEYAEKFNAELTSYIQTTNEVAVTRHLNYAKNQCFSPWIEKIIFRDKTNNVETFMPDRKTIPNIIGQLQTVPDGASSFFNNAKKYIADTKLSHIGYPYDVCPACGKPIASAVNGLIPCDVQSTFFYLSVMRLSSL
jgi:hypothetical protein